MLFDDLNKDYIAAYKARDIVKKDILSSIISKYSLWQKMQYGAP